MALLTFDPVKNAANIAKHGISLARAQDFKVLAILRDVRFDCGEERFRAFGTIAGVHYCLVFAEREGSLRIISLRRAHMKEISRHAKV
jgi:uncharacterized protein